jgi:uncharacterized protein (DUF2267 family)
MVGPQPHEHRDPGRDLLQSIKGRLPTGISAEDAVRAVMCTFNQHVSGSEARKVFEALPATLHPLLQRCMLHRRDEAESFGRDQLIVRVGAHLGVSLEEAESVTSTVLKAISAGLPKRTVGEVAQDLPLELRDLWVDEQLVEPHPLLLAIEERVPLPPGVTGQRAMLYVMCNVTRRLAKTEARRLVDGLPHEVRPLLVPCVTARAEQAEHITKRDLLDHVAKDLHAQSPEPIVRGVLEEVRRWLRPELVEEVTRGLPPELAQLWREPD